MMLASLLCLNGFLISNICMNKDDDSRIDTSYGIMCSGSQGTRGL